MTLKRYKATDLIGKYFFTMIDDMESDAKAWRLQYGYQPGPLAGSIDTIDPALDITDGFDRYVEAVVVSEEMAHMIGSYARFYAARRMYDISSGLFDECDTEQTALEMDTVVTRAEAQKTTKAV